MRNSFWLRWQQEYLHQYQQPNKYHGISLYLKKDGIVLLEDELTPPGQLLLRL